MDNIDNKSEKDYDLEQPESMKIHGEPDDVVYMKDLPSGCSNLLQALQGRVPGLNISGNRAIIRGINTFYGDTDPLLLVDGVPTDFSTIHMISPEDVERVEILKGPSSAIYGSRGGNGVIAIYTKRGRFMRKGVIDFNMLGYYSAREFYLPKYGETNSEINIDDKETTLYWNPEIRTDSSGKVKIFFINYDTTGYTINIQGIANSGEPISVVYTYNF